MRKRILSCMLTIAMVVSISATTAISTSAEETKDIRGTIYFDSTDLYGATKDNVMYCYTWSDTEGAMFGWDSKSCKMTNVEDFLYSYDVPTKNSKGDEVDANLMIFHALGGIQTMDLTFDDSCMGDTAYVSGDYYGLFPVNSESCLPKCSWKNNKSNGAHITINSLGKVYGVSLTKNETPESVVDAFINDYKAGMEAGKTGYDNPELVTDENRDKLIDEIEKIVAENTEAPTDEATEPTEVPTDDATEATEIPTEAPTENKTELPTTSPTEKPTTNATSATTATQKVTTAPTTATTSTNTSNGTVNTSQASAVTTLALTVMASMGVVFLANKKREKAN